MCKENFDDVEVKKQENAVVTKGLDLNVSAASNSSDIRSYFSPQRKRKHSEEEVEDFFNDGMDELLCDIDF